MSINMYSSWSRYDLESELGNLKLDMSYLQSSIKDIEQALADYEKDEEPPYCTACAGTGEGQYDGSSCYSCGGKGFATSPRDADDY